MDVIREMEETNRISWEENLLNENWLEEIKIKQETKKEKTWR